jgi:hypothetical protein
MKIDLFPIPVYHFKVPNHEEIKNQYLPEILHRYENEYYDKSSLNWHTRNVHTSFENKDQVIKELPPIYSELFDRVMPFRWEGKFVLWHNVYKTFEYQEIHHHIPGDFSAIHFLSFDKTEHNPPVFFDPGRLPKEKLSYQRITAPNSTHIDVDEGSFLIFPSYLEHLVPASKQEYTKHRVTVSINLTLTHVDNDI